MENVNMQNQIILRVKNILKRFKSEYDVWSPFLSDRSYMIIGFYRFTLYKELT